MSITKETKLKMLNEFEKDVNLIYEKNCEKDDSQYFKDIQELQKVWEIGRIEIINKNNDTNTVNIFKKDNAIVTYPDWLKNEESIGCKILSNKDMNIIFECVNDGDLLINIRAPDYRILGNRKQVYINYTQFEVNNEVIFNDNKTIWHNIPYNYNVKCKDKEVFRININFSTIYDYFPTLKEYIINTIENFENPQIVHLLIEKFLKREIGKI